MSVLVDRAKEAHYIVYEFMSKNNLSYEEYSFVDFTNYIIDRYNIVFEKIDFGNALGSQMNGITITKKNTKKWLIHVNKNMISTRQNFTICHEISHFIWDCCFGSETKVYTSYIETEYSDDEEVERLADSAAGIIMIPDICIIDSFNKKLSFNQIARKYKISHSALKYRLIQFVLLNINAPGNIINEITGAVERFIYKSDPTDYLFYLGDEVFMTTKRVKNEFLNASTYNHNNLK